MALLHRYMGRAISHYLLILTTHWGKSQRDIPHLAPFDRQDRPSEWVCSRLPAKICGVLPYF